MPRKALRVQIELDIQAVTCPGVWLCPNGKVFLQIYMLDSCIQTAALPPVFPLLYHEQFIFYKTFHSAHTLIELQRLIDKDFLYAELLQWSKGCVGNVIASFQTSLHDVLYPSSLEGTLSGVDVDLLMEPSKIFPGIIAPKIEISTRTTVEEILCSSERPQSSHYVTNPKTIPSDYLPRDLKRNSKLPRQKKVCHSVEYHRSRKCIPKRSFEMKPPFVFKKADEELLSRKPQGINDNYTTKMLQVRKLEPSPRLYKCVPRSALLNTKEQKCACGSGHTVDDCEVCTQYSSYFNSNNLIDDCCNTADAFVRKIYSDPAQGSAENLCRYKHSPQSANNSQIPLCGSPKGPLCNSKYCVRCSVKQKPSLAKKIHGRIMRTLDFCSPVNNCDGGQNLVSGGCTPKFGYCDHEYYDNLEKCYRENYQC